MPQLTLLKPLITEKTMRLAQAGQFTFIVAKEAAKPAIAQAVEGQFKVNAIKVTTSSTKGKIKKTGKRRLSSKTSTAKKAIVTLKAGQMIEFFSSKGRSASGRKLPKGAKK